MWVVAYKQVSASTMEFKFPRLILDTGIERRNTAMERLSCDYPQNEKEGQ